MAYIPNGAEERFGVKTSGRVRLQRKWEKPALIAVGALMILVAIVILTVDGFNNEVGLSTLSELTDLIFAAAEVVLFLLGVFVTMGTELKYDADDKQFILHKPNKPDEVFFYEDIEEVRFTPTRFFWRDRGYKVLIRTKYRDFDYVYIYTKNKLDRTPKGSPFFIIAERAGLTEQSVDNRNKTAVWRRAEQGG